MKKLTAFLNTLSTILVIVAAGAMLWSLYGRPAVADGRPPAVPTEVNGTLAKEQLRNSLGNGPIALIEFTDFQCPFCARHSQQTFPELKKTLIDTGKVRYAVVNLPLQMHQQAIPAAEAAECAAEQGKYWEMHDGLFARQKELAEVDLPSVAHNLGLDTKAFEQCLETDAALARVTADLKEAERLGVRATPTLFLGRVRPDGGVNLLRQLNGALPVETFVAEVAKLTQG